MARDIKVAFKELLGNNIESVPEKDDKAGVESLAQQWAKKYLQTLQPSSYEENLAEGNSLADVVSQAGREKTAQKLMDSLRVFSLNAWNKTEALLSQEVQRHRINPKLINPWEVAADSFKVYEKTLHVYTQQAPLRQLSMVMKLARVGDPLYEKALEIYTEQVAPSQLATGISANVGAIRKKYTQDDPRVIGFVSMQFHYTSQMLLQSLSPLERTLVGAYFKVIDDHLYMPLQRAYEGAANQDYHSPALSAVRKLIPLSTPIANKITNRVIQLYPNYRSYTGLLSEPAVKNSTIRDVEMFQVYLWVCALEGSVASIQHELFPLCVMLYPTLKVEWELIRQMLHLLGLEISANLTAKEANTVMPYFQVLWHLFSPEVFGSLEPERKSNSFDPEELWSSLFELK